MRTVSSWSRQELARYSSASRGRMRATSISVRSREMGVRNSWEALPVKVRTLAKALSMRSSIWLRVWERSEISSLSLGTGRRSFEVSFVDARALRAASAATGRSALRLIMWPPDGGEQNHDRREQQETGAEVDQQGHGLVQRDAGLHGVVLALGDDGIREDADVARALMKFRNLRPSGGS